MPSRCLSAWFVGTPLNPASGISQVHFVYRQADMCLCFDLSLFSVGSARVAIAKTENSFRLTTVWVGTASLPHALHRG